MEEFIFKVNCIVRKIKNNTITLEDLDMSVLDSLENSLNFIGGLDNYINIKLWTNFKNDVENGMSALRIKLYIGELERSFSSLAPYIERVYSKNSYIETVVTMQGVIKSLENMYNSYSVAEALID